MIKFSLSEGFIEKYRGKQPAWGPLGLITFKRTYARPIPEENRTEEWWETLQRVVEGTYTIQKRYCEGLKLPWNGVKAQHSAQEMFRLMWEMKFLPPGRGLWMMGTDFVEKRGGASLNNCFQYDTEIVTLQGTRKIGELCGCIPTLLTKNGKWVKAPIIGFGSDRLWKLTLSRQGKTKEIFTTANHGWFVTDRRQEHRNKGFIRVETKDLRPNIHRLQYVFGSNQKGKQASPFGVACGIVFGDGTRTQNDKHNNRIRLCGRKDRELLPFFHGCSLSTIEDDIIVSDIPNYFKELPSLSETRSYLYGWLKGYFAADGSVGTNGQITLSSYSYRNIIYIRDLCYLLGIGTYGIVETTRISNLTNREAKCHTITFMGATLDSDFFCLSKHRQNFEQKKTNIIRKWTIERVEETDRIENVYCASVDKYHAFALADNILTSNCSYVSTENLGIEFSEPFCFLMDMSMLGVGVGSDTKGAGSIKIKEPRQGSYTFVVEDTREGWVELVRTYLDAYFGRGVLPSEVDYSKVRPYGSPIKSFGGKASGPAPLKQLAEKDIPTILDPLIDSPISSEAIVDLFNAIGKCVVSGNVRRSAEIMLGDPEDNTFLELKDPAKNKKKLNDWRWASNNSLFAEIGMDYSKVAKLTAKNGEPGYFWLDTARQYGRLADPPDPDRDSLCVGTNPCAEQSLESYELCTLVETFPGRHETFEEYQRTLKLAYLYAKTVTLIPTHNARTNAVMLRNRRIGTSQSGIAQSFRRHGIRQHYQWCDRGYEYLRSLDRTYSRWLCVPESIKVTSVKPSGTVSLLPGATPGVHFPYAEYYWRTIRMDKGSELVKTLQKAGYRVEDVEGHNTVAVYFPVKEENFYKSRSDLSIWEQLEIVAQMQYWWADNQVSVTITFSPEEATQIKQALELYETRLKSVSFLPLTEHGFKHAPYQPMTKEEYEKAVKKLKLVKLHNVAETSGFEHRYCDNDRCEITAP